MSNLSPAAVLHNTSSVEVGTATDPLRVDPTGTTAQPVTDNGGSLTVDGSVSVSNFPAVQPVSDNGGSLTVDGTVAVSGSVAVTGPLTDTQLRATPVPVSGTVTANAGTGPWPVTDNGGSLTVDGTVAVSSVAGTVAVSGPLTDTQLRASAVPVSAASLPLPTGAATEATLALIKAKTDNLDVALSTRAVTGLTDAQLRATAVPVSATQLPAALVGGRLDENLGAWLGSTAPTVGQKLAASSIPVIMASDSDPIAIYVDSPAGAATGITSATITLGGGSANTLNLVSGTTYNEQGSAAARSISSSSASDAAAGVGARKVRITYFDNTMAGPFTEIITLNGTTAVATVATNIRFIEKMVVTEVGSTGYNVGTLTLFVNNTGGGGTVGTIGVGTIAAAIGDNRTFWGHHYVATGVGASLSTVIAAAISGGSGTNATLFLRAKNPLVADEPEVIISDLLLTNGGVVRLLTNPIKLTGPMRVRPFAVPAVNNATLNASFDWAEV